ncbi:MAG TPA: AI-2E family transporter [Candidatus Baltobacteraceae bacterium]|jgi:predicted PurR-regulated permease PerM
MATRGDDSKRLTALQVLATLALTGLLVYGIAMFLLRVQAVLVIAIVAIFLAYVIYPLVHWLARRMPVIVAILIVYLVVAITLALITIFMVPPLIADTATFVRSVPRTIVEVSRDIVDPRNPLFAWLPAPIRAYLSTLPGELVGFTERYAFDAIHQIATYLVSAVALIATLIVVPILTAYMLLDQENLVRVFLGLFPSRTRPKAKAVLLDLDHVLGGFIRGQMIDAVIVGVLMFVVLTIFRVPYAYLIAVFSGVFQVIPYLGAVVAFFPAVTLALVYNGDGNALAVAIAVVAIHQLDGNVIAPRIMRDSVGLSPLWVIISVLAFTELFGFPGTFVAVPTAAMLRVLKMHFLPAPVEAEDVPATPRDESLRMQDEITNVS